MTAVVTGNPLEFTATTEGKTGPFFVSSIVVHTLGTGGAFELLTASGGRSLYGAPVLGVNDWFIHYPMSHIEGIYVQTLPTDAEVHVFIGGPPR